LRCGRRGQLEAAHKQNIERQEVAERAARRRLANEARKKIRPGRARDGAAGDKDKEQVDINNMLSDLRSGRAFAQKVNGE
jgi:hypothetical protein